LLAWLGILTVVFVPLERVFALHRQRVFRRRFAMDLGFYFLNGFLPKMVLTAVFGAIGWVLHLLVPEWWRAMIGSLPGMVRLLAAMLVGEIGFYWGHRWSHEIPFLWSFHRVHHSAEEMDWLVNTRAHPVDLVFTRLCGLIPLYVLGLVQPERRVLDVTVSIVLATGIAWGFFIHANLKWRFGPLEHLIASPAFHHWHHTMDEPLNKNFAPMLPWVDRIFGTHYSPTGTWPDRYGVREAGVREVMAEPGGGPLERPTAMN
jgi:sterol desaturase/sphingolipid hydroxylase (fatty acid hydroxylase superfamily)